MVFETNLVLDDAVIRLIEKYTYDEVFDVIYVMGEYTTDFIAQLVNKYKLYRLLGMKDTRFYSRLDLIEDIRDIGWEVVHRDVNKIEALSWEELDNVIKVVSGFTNSSVFITRKLNSE